MAYVRVLAHQGWGVMCGGGEHHSLGSGREVGTKLGSSLV